MDSDIPKAQADPRRAEAAIEGLTLVNLLVFWLIAGFFLRQPSERMYAALPLAYACGALWKGLFVGWRAALRRALLGSAILAGVLCVRLYERHSGPGGPGALVDGELTVSAYLLAGVVLVSRWIYLVVAGLVNRVLRVRPGGSRSRALASRVVALLVFSFVVTGYLMAVLQTHFPKQRSDSSPRMLRRNFETVRFASRDGTMLTGWFVPVEGSDRTAIVCHGVGAYKADMLDFIEALAEGGYNTLAFDFRGHGESDGHTTSYGAMEKLDVRAAIDWMEAQHPQRARRIVGVGWSMGAASLILAAAEDDRMVALHVDAAYARTRDIARVIAAQFPPLYEQAGYYWGLTLASLEAGANLFALVPLDAIGGIAPRPILIVHGENDVLIPIAQGRLLFEAAGEPKAFVAIPGAGHCGTIGVETPRYQERMLEFLNDALADDR